MKWTIWLLIFFLTTLQCVAQTFKGKVTDQKGESISYASLYLKEIKSGITTDANGCFQITLSPGRYTCEVSSIGFTGQTFSFQLLNRDVEKNFILEEQVYMLDEVSVVRGSENPAYSIMRHAIARAPFFRTQVTGFTAGTYLKGTGKMMSIPVLLKLSKEIRTESKKAMGKLFVLEEQREVTFEAPNQWTNQIKAYRNSFPENIEVSIGLNMVRFYEPTIFGKVSPLSRGAFSYYDFKYDGCYLEGDRVVNRIKVIPKKESSRLLEGELFIVEDLWCVTAANFTIKSTGMKATVKVICKEVQPSVFLPTSTSMKSAIDLVGFKIEASYLAAVHYTKVKTGAWHPKVTSAEKAPISKKLEKLNRQIEELTSKNKMTLSDAYKLSKLMERTIKEKDTLQSKHKYELPSLISKVKEQTDSLAGSKDSLYWNSIRSVPLGAEEVQSYINKEKIEVSKDSLTDGKIKKQSIGGKILNTFFLGRKFQSANEKFWMTLSGLPSYIPQYNFVDGFWLGAKVQTGIKFSESVNLQLTPSAYYTSARKEWIGQGELLLNYAPRRQGQFSFIGGILSADYNQETGESILINSLSTSLFGRNDVKLFEKRFLAASHRIEIANGLLFSTSLSWERRNMLENHISQSWFKKKAESNVPETAIFQPMPENEILKASFSLEYTPAHYYRLNEGKKIYDDSRYPTFGVGYTRAFPLKGNIVSPSYHLVTFSARQKIEFGMFNELHWQVNAGAFWDKNQMQFPDFHHFASTKFPVTERSFDNGFSLLDNYAYSTADRWAQANISWYTPYLLIKHLPFLKKKMFDEALHVRSLVTFRNLPYTEAGYSVGLSNLGRIGVFVGFECFKYRSVGISVSIPLATFTRN